MDGYPGKQLQLVGALGDLQVITYRVSESGRCHSKQPNGKGCLTGKASALQLGQTSNAFLQHACCTQFLLLRTALLLQDPAMQPRVHKKTYVTARTYRHACCLAREYALAE